MEEETLERGYSGRAGGRSVQPIPENRVADAGQMNAYLVSAARSGLCHDERVISQSEQYLPVRASVTPAFRACCHTRAASRITRNRLRYGARIARKPSVQQCDVGFVYRARPELIR